MARQTLFDHDYSIDLPEQGRFPINERLQDRRVLDELARDIRDSEDYLIITGFTSLSQLIDVFGAGKFPKLKKLRIAIGFDPDERVSKRLAHYSLTTEIKNFWLKQNVSIKLCSPIINLIEKINSGQYNFRVKDKMHAKLYVGDKAAILGSSNFSKSGTTRQVEANIRVTVNSSEAELTQYSDIKKLAEYYYEKSQDYNTQITDLLKSLLKDATWEESLARAIAEILESNWMKQFPVLYNALQNQQLWPSQRIGIGKAMRIIQDQGRVLIADPTGSGKTKFAVTLAYTLFHWLWENGLKDRSAALTICPKQVMDNWEREQEPFKIPCKIESMGNLSHSKHTKSIRKDIQERDILIIDEAHNFLRPFSIRSRSINPKAASHIILSTATPINKKPEDLLRLIELLDIDNLSDDDLKTYRELKRHRKQLNQEQLGKLKKYIAQFIVRRTKKELNQMINREPAKYKNRDNHVCRYPKTRTDIYGTGETKPDEEIATRIRDLCLQLKGINYLQTWKIPSYIKSKEERAQYIDRRFRSSGALAAFMIRSCLRSSACSLIEYLHGTDRAKKEYGIECSKPTTGNIISKIEKCKTSFKNIHFPVEYISEERRWISEEHLFGIACEEETRIYEQISKLALTLSGKREQQKADKLVALMKQYGKIIAFDSKVITLDYIRHLVLQHDNSIKVLVASGSEEKNKKLVKEAFTLNSPDREPLIALLSDAMSEGINLTDAKALVLLDMPSVLRIIEQRIGRLERMDSEHDEIHVFWPDDSPAFSLKGDERIIEILLMAEGLIGTNVDIPQQLYDRRLKDVNDAKDIVKRYETAQKNDEEWEGVKDSTQSLYKLIEGKDALITPELYHQFVNVEAPVKSAISFVEADKAFSFFAFRGDTARSAKWLLLDERNNYYTDFSEIAEKLTEYLGKGNTIQRKWKEVDVDAQMKIELRRLRSKEKELLPPKKKRALRVWNNILNELSVTIAENDPRKPLMQKLLSVYEPDQDPDSWIDYNHFAELLLSILLPVIDRLRSERKRRTQIINLGDLRLKHFTLTEEMLTNLYESCQLAATPDELVAACIIGLQRKEV